MLSITHCQRNANQHHNEVPCHAGQNAAAAAAKSLQSCPTLCDPIDGSPPGSPVPGILQARTLEWVAISSSNTWKWKVKVKLLSCVQLFATPWTAAYQAPPPMGFSRQEYWSGVPLPSPICTIVQHNLWLVESLDMELQIQTADYKVVHQFLTVWRLGIPKSQSCSRFQRN